MKRPERIVVGMDPSSKLLAATITFDKGDPELWKKTLPDTTYDIRSDWAERHTEKLVKELARVGPVYFFVEEPVVGQGARATIAQSICLGGVLIGARRGGAKEIHLVHNMRWKKDVVGAGNVNKAQIKRYVHQTWPVLYDLIPRCTCKGKTCHCGAQDLCDSACINAHGDHILDMKERIQANRSELP